MKNARYVVIFIVLCLSVPSWATIYQWTDSKGNVHFSDTPHPGAKEIELQPAQTFSSPIPEQPIQKEESSPETAPLTMTAYTIEILEPHHEETIRDAQRTVDVKLSVQPELKEGDRLQILYDGAPIGDPKATTFFQLQQVNPGTHTIAAQVVNSKHQVLNTSEPITIFMHPPRVGMVPGTRGAGSP